MFTQTYASHCMQTALELANTFLADRLDEASDAQAQRPDGEPLESLLELVNLFVENVLPRLGEVSCDVNGSHVLRSLLCVLLGCPNDRAAVKKHIVKGALMKKVSSSIESLRESACALGPLMLPVSPLEISLMADTATPRATVQFLICSCIGGTRSMARCLSAKMAEYERWFLLFPT